MLPTIVQYEVTNELTPYPEFIYEYRVISEDGSTINRCDSEDEAYAILAKLTALADIRDQ
tara:strand:- start:3554 stop:3733 length:180 start_codon:yes stop_codon:yes gene_type:complete